MFGLNPLLLAGVSAAAIAGAWWLGHESGTRERDGNLGRNFEQTLSREREIAIRREVNLWTQIGDERQARVELIATVERVDELSAEARAKMLAALAAEKTQNAAALAAAKRNIEELKGAATQMAQDWKAGRIPPDITCGVFDAKGCPEPAYPAASPNREDSLAVRESAPVLSAVTKLP